MNGRDPMRHGSIRLLSCAWGVIAAVVLADVKALPAAPPENAPAAPILAVAEPLSPENLDTHAAGLSEGSRPEVLTWERAYDLALIHGRAPRAVRGSGLAPTLDPKALAEQAGRLGVADFARFRKEFLDEREGSDKADASFHDPSASVFDLLRRLQRIENGLKDARVHEQLVSLIKSLAEGEATAQTRFELDQVDNSLQQTRLLVVEELMLYRDRLDEVKVELGLSPRAPVVPDWRSLAAFRFAFETADAWQRKPGRKLTDLAGIAGQLPRLDDAVLAGLRGGPDLDTVAHQHMSLLEGVLSAAEQAAVKNRGADVLDDGLGLRVRRRVRHLLTIYQEYAVENRRFVLILRQKDQAFERLIEPPAAGATRLSTSATDLIGQETRLLQTENRLVDLWASFHTERLALYRDLHTLPYADWKSFHAQFPTELPPAPAKK
jgi:hypothetical protein